MAYMMALGEYRFSISNAAYHTMRRRERWNWSQSDTLGSRPSFQFVGYGGEVITLQGRIYPHFRGGLHQIDTLRSQGDAAKPHLLVAGSGIVFGRYCITELEETLQVLDDHGLPRRIDFTVELLRHSFV